MFRRLFMPYFNRRWQAARQYLDQVNPSVKLMLHSCGSVRKLIPDLIGAGIQVLDPIQPRAAGMDSFELKQEFGSQLTFHGGVDIQEVLPFGTVEEVEAEVKMRIKALAPGGGYLLSTSHFIQSDTPPANIVAMCRAVHKHGQYPLEM
jgi:uroporphyrinogen decarboxylase